MDTFDGLKHNSLFFSRLASLCPGMNIAYITLDNRLMYYDQYVERLKKTRAFLEREGV
jgi:hypothetical protein